MSRLDLAIERFAAALEALDAGVNQRLSSPRNGKVSLNEYAKLKSEREDLLARIAVLEEESRALAGLTEEVEGRLDGAIAEIRSALGRG